MGGKPFQDGDEPEHDSHGSANEEFAAVVFDEAFVRAAQIHEPTASERMLAAAQARAEAEARRSRTGSPPTDEEFYDEGYDPEDDADGEYDRHDGDGYDADVDDGHGPYGRYGGALGPYRGHARWHRPVAFVLAVLMGVGVVALAFAAVYRGTAGSRQEPTPPPATTGVDVPRIGKLTGQPSGPPPASVESAAPTAPAPPRPHRPDAESPAAHVR